MKRFLITTSIVLGLSFTAGAQILPSADPHADSLALASVRARMDSIRQYRPTVALVLAGGGARGFAHLGVIRCLEEMGIPVDIVTGTSMGGLVAGMYSLGYNWKQLDSITRAIDWPIMMSDRVPDAYVAYRLRKDRERFLIKVPFGYDKEDLLAKRTSEQGKRAERMAREANIGTSDMLDEAVSRAGMGMPDGFLFGINIRNMLSSVSVGYQDSLSFNRLPRAFACVATDMYSLTPKYWLGGQFSDALRSTMAIPFFFRAVRKDGAVLLDGALRNNYPADIAREMGADIVIGSEMSTPLSMDELGNPVNLLFQGMDLLGTETFYPGIDMADVNINHPLEGYTVMSFDDKSVDDIIGQGYQNALSQKEKLEVVAQKVRSRQDIPRPATATNISYTKIKVDQVLFNGITDKEQKHLINHRLFRKDGMYDRKDIEMLLGLIYGTSAFESVTYHLTGTGEPYTLVFDCQKGQVNDAAFGLHADTDEQVYIAAHLGLGTRRLFGPRFIADIKVGGNPSVTLDAAVKPMLGIPSFGVCFNQKYTSMSFSTKEASVNHKLLSLGLDGYVEDSRMTYGTMRAGISAEINPYEHYLSAGKETMTWDWSKIWYSAYGKLRVDTFDDGYFPTKGFRFQVDGRYCFDPSYWSNFTLLEIAVTAFDNFTIQPSLFSGWNSIDPTLMNPRHTVAVGGIRAGRYIEHQMPFFGFASGFMVCSSLSGSATLDLRYRFLRKNFVTLRGGLFQDSPSYKVFFKSRPTAWAAGLEYARQAIVGPIRIGAQWCNITGFSASMTVGFDF